MSYKDAMNEAIAGYLRDSYSLDAVKVVDFDDRTVYDGYCETCYYEYTVCDITYVDSDGNTKEYEYYGGFADLVRGIT